MSNILFCLIFIQLCVFLIAGILLITSVVLGSFEKEGQLQIRAMARPRPRRQKPAYTPEPLTRPEIEYLLGS